MSPDPPTPDVQATTEVPLLAGRYQFLEKLGEGGMGAVFRARDAKLDRPVAIKMLPEGSTPDADAVVRFKREAKALARLAHPGIIQAYDSGEEGGRPFLVMELVEGHSLAAVLREQGRVAPARAADFAYQAALALDHAHRSGLVHRDVKPSNLLLSADGRVRLLDLGLARFLQDQIGEAHLTRTGTGMGTPDYCPPEQFRDARRADARSDVYSLGCTLYHLIAGRVPFPGSSFSEKVEAHETKEPAPLEEVCPEVPGGLALTVRRMMAKRPADRFGSMAEAAEALMPHVAGSSASFLQIRKSATWDGSRLATMPALPRRRRVVALAVTGAAVALLLVTAGLVGLAAGWFRPGGPQVAQGTEPETAPEPAPADTGPAKPADAPRKEEDVPKPGVVTDPDVLTVSKEEKGGGKYRTIAAALEAVRPSQTIRVLDGATYEEAVLCDRSATQARITIEAVRQATLAPPDGTDAGVRIAGVERVTLRGFRLKGAAVEAALVQVEPGSVGTVLEGLELELPGDAKRVTGVRIAGVNAGEGDPPVVVRNCYFRSGYRAIQLYGMGAPCRGVVLRDNVVSASGTGVSTVGAVRRVQVVGNRLTGCVISAFQLEEPAEEMASVLVANNTCYQCRHGVRLADAGAKGKHVRVCNNLVLEAARPDMVYYQVGPKLDGQPQPADGALLAKSWPASHNWREVAEPKGATPDERAWVPPGPKDVRQDEIKGINRDPKSPDFLRPNPKSPLATDGAGNEDPSLPCYVGALPPEGTEPWDWERAWRLPKGAQLLTVSKEEKGGGKYRSIGDALKDVIKPWATIRVLDAEVYDESLVLDDPRRHEGLALEAPRHATLRLTADRQQAVSILGVPHARVVGVRFRQSGAARGSRYVSVTGHAPGVVLAGLDLEGPGTVDGIFLTNVRASPPEAPVVVRDCRVHVPYDGIMISGPVNPTGATTPVSGVVVRDNRVWGGYRGICLLGAAARVQVTGNLVWDFKMAALQIQDLGAGPGPILIANNTAFGSDTGFRIWNDPPHEKPRQGQVELANNFLFDCRSGDVQYVLSQGSLALSRGDVEALRKCWTFRHNARDGAGGNQELVVPVTAEDQNREAVELVSRQPGDADFLRPDSASPLAREGAGRFDPALPPYVGAVPPKGALPWDWDRTWQMRTKKADDKK